MHSALKKDGKALYEYAREGIEIERAHLHARRTLHAVIDARHRQAAFVVDLLLGTGPGNLGIDEHLEVIMGFGRVNDDQLLMHVDLGRRQAHAWRFIHGLGHIGGELF